MSRKNYRRTNNLKKLIIASLITLLVAVITFVIAYNSYNKKVKENLQNSMLKANDLADMIANENSDNMLEEANSQIGKSIEESMSTQVPEITEQVTPTPAPTIIAPTPTPEPVVVEEPMPEFIMPVDNGVIMREYAKESLLFSQTLDEWVTHLGIDIQADKTAVVKASAPGTVTAIKNDPRYGLTVVIEHTKGFKTVYSNLLTAEYVSIGQTVESGQTLGTVGNTATFEILDEYHLHFEILENEENVDPNAYLNQ